MKNAFATHHISGGARGLGGLTPPLNFLLLLLVCLKIPTDSPHGGETATQTDRETVRQTDNGGGREGGREREVGREGVGVEGHGVGGHREGEGVEDSPYPSNVTGH